MNLLLRLILAIYFVLYASITYAEEAYIYEAGMKITLGMSKKVLLPKLKKTHKVEMVPNSNDEWFVSDLKTNKVVLTVRFHNDILQWAGHDYKTYSEKATAYSLGHSLLSLFEEIIKNNKGFCVITTDIKRNADIAMESIYFNFNNKMIELVLVRGAMQRTVQVQESIFSK
jgi:hypothetical protein